MKKLSYAFIVLCISVLSCNSDDDAASPSDDTINGNILPIQVDIVDSSGETETIKYTYEGNTLVKAEYSDGSYYDYLYEDNKLTKINNYFPTFSPILESYTYDAQDRIATITTTIAPLPSNVYNLSYNANNSVITTSNVSDNTYQDVLTLSNGNIVTYDEGGVFISTYTYDDKNAPFKNVTHRETFLTIYSENNLAIDFTANNMLTENILEIETSINESYTYTYTYTDSNFPRTVQENFEGDITIYTYTYNND